jgi:hypothetical protein
VNHLRALVLALLLAVTWSVLDVTPAVARKLTIVEKHTVEQQKARKAAHRAEAAESRRRAIRMKMRKTEQARRIAIKNGEDPEEIDEQLEVLRREQDGD